MSTPPRAVFLDLGNVLVFHDNAHLFSTLGARAGLGASEVQERLLRDEWTQANRGTLDPDAIHDYVNQALGLELDAPTFFELWNCHFTVHDAVLPHVEALRQRVRVGVISNTNPVHVSYLRARLPLLARLDPLVLSCEAGHVKPEPAIFELALARAGCRADEAVFFDDLPEYVAAAERVGLKARLFTTAEAFAKDLAALGLGALTPSARPALAPVCVEAGG